MPYYFFNITNMDRPINELTKPEVSIREEELASAGFINSGKTKFKSILQDFSNQLFYKAVRYGDAEKGELEREITQEHVYSASYNIFRKYGRKDKSIWAILGQIGEYLFTGLAGVGGGRIETTWGVLMFGVSLAIAIILIVIRLTTSKD